MLAYITEIVRKGKVNYRCGRLLYTYNGLNAVVFSAIDYLLYSFSGLALISRRSRASGTRLNSSSEIIIDSEEGISFIDFPLLLSNNFRELYICCPRLSNSP